MSKTFICSDESVNSHGYCIRTAGIDLTAFKKNPIMLWNHNQTGSDILPIGKWEDISAKDGVLSAKAVFDESDDFAKKIAQKVENGFISACSIGVTLTNISEEKSNFKAGQSLPTVTECILREISICDIPSNSNAVSVVLYDNQDNIINLSDCKAFGMIEPRADTNISLRTLLGLSEVANENDIYNSVKQLKEKEKNEKLNEIENLLSVAVSNRRILVTQKAHFREIGLKLGAETLKITLGSIPETIYLPGLLDNTCNQASKSNFETSKPKHLWNMEDYRRYAPQELEKNPTLYQSLLKTLNDN